MDTTMTRNLRKQNLTRPHKWERQGSITVEAAFVMPIVLLTIFAILYLSFYLHDMCRIQGSIDMALHKAGLNAWGSTPGSNTQDSIRNNIPGSTSDNSWNNRASDAEKQIELYLRQQLSQGLFLSKVTGITVKAEGSSLEASAEVDTSVTIPMVKALFAGISHRTMKEEYPIHNPGATIRQCEVILDTASEIKGMSELQEAARKFLDSK